MENVTVHSRRINEFMFISPGGSSKKNCFSFLLKRSQVRWLVHLIRMHPAPAGEIRYPLEPGNDSGSPRRNWKALHWRKMSGIPGLSCCRCAQTSVKWKKMNRHTSYNLCSPQSLPLPRLNESIINTLQSQTDCF